MDSSFATTVPSEQKELTAHIRPLVVNEGHCLESGDKRDAAIDRDGEMKERNTHAQRNLAEREVARQKTRKRQGKRAR